MSPNPVISIIIPVYNVAEYITECLQSVMRQTYSGEIECILVDDCGSDDSIAITEQLIADYKGSISFRILHHEHNRGLSAARNSGTEAATGDYIYYLDSDDYISNDCIEILSKPLIDGKYDVIIGNYQTTENPAKSFDLFDITGAITDNHTIFQQYAERHLPVMAWNKLCSREFLTTNNISFLEGQLHEDELWTYKIFHQANSIFVENKITYTYLIRSSSITGMGDKNRIKKANAYWLTLTYMMENSHMNTDAYIKVLKYYTKMYLGFACETRRNFLTEYLHVRKNLPISRTWGSKSPLNRQTHFCLPPLLGYYFLFTWSLLSTYSKNSI